ncbi:MAG: hypothetical protein H6667_03900 [Ardenticatenaceae bacterium]|nr:hypothetical protein [Ardenticatenaceae bacterium]
MEEEIDLRPYIRAIFRAWYWIVGAAVLAALAAYGISTLSPEKYEAEAIVAIVRERTDVSFDTSIETQEDVLGSRDIGSRREALIALVASNDVAQQVLIEMGDRLAPGDRNAAVLLKKVSASNTGDLIVVRISHEDPQMAAEIANVWAQVYEQYINALYVSGTSTRPEMVTEQAAAAKMTYEAAQADLEAFIGDNEVDLLQNEINAKNALLSSYLTATTSIQAGPIQFQANVRQELLANYYADLGNVEIWLADAQALREQVAADAGSTATPAGSTAVDIGNALALISLRSRVFGGSGQTIILQLDLANELPEPVTVADVDALIAVLKTRRAETQANIESLSISFAEVAPAELVFDENSPSQKQITELGTNLLQLREKLTAQYAQQQELTQARDLAWDTYQALAIKEAEVKIAAESTGTEVRLASNAAVPYQSQGTGGVLLAIVAGVVSGMLAVFGVTAVYWWQDVKVAEPVRKQED